MTNIYVAADTRYSQMKYRKVGNSGLRLPVISLGLWHNFGHHNHQETMRDILRYSFDHGICHFDLANNYGPPAGSAEENFSQLFKSDFLPYRDECIISTKAGYYMWEGPYGDGGSRKYLISSLDQSLKRLGLDYVDIFYHHRMDKDTPLEETALALSQIVNSGKALYIGLSNYDSETMIEMSELLKDLKVPFIINQNSYSIFNRRIEDDKFKEANEKVGKGIIVYSPLDQGLLTERYLLTIPEDSRIKTDGRFLKESDITEEKIKKVKQLKCLADSRGQSLAALALSWILKDEVISSVLIGASKVEQVKDNLSLLDNMTFSKDELNEIEKIVHA